MKKECKLYNLLFPMWLLWVFPPFIIVCGVGNLIIDAAVILIAAKCLKIDCFFKKNKTSILKAWGLGFAADFIGAGFLFAVSQALYFLGTSFESLAYLNDYVRWNVDYNPFANMYALLLTILAIAISGICIYLFNKKISFKKVDMTEHQKKVISLVMAIATSPYLFLIPGELFF
ncbi:MAG: hypothetical protein IJB19_05785 [Clostridia bacterium]|nr:hypothetical protein [Clostridia bacterium]